MPIVSNSAELIRPTTPRRYKLSLEYDGTNFSGWQKQNDARTVQGDLLKGAERVFGPTPIDIQGCGRTDSGVHARNYVAHLEVTSALEPEVVLALLNDTLPKDIAVLAVESVHPRFHARHSCIARGYIYQLKKRKSAFAKRYNWWIREELDIRAMQDAAAIMVGMHDFAALAEKPELKKSTRVLVHQVRVMDDADGLRIGVVGSHFLWHMVRRMVGLLVEVGGHRLTIEEVRRLLDAAAPLSFMHTAPPAGLFFARAFYDAQELEDYLAQ